MCGFSSLKRVIRVIDPGHAVVLADDGEERVIALAFLRQPVEVGAPLVTRSGYALRVAEEAEVQQCELLAAQLRTIILSQHAA